MAAREIIDWSLPGASIYDRKRPLSPKTMDRIAAGLRKYGIKSFIVPQHSSNGPRSTDDPAPTVTTTSRGVGFAEAFIISMEQGGHLRSINTPLNTVTTAKGGAHAPVQPFIVSLSGTSPEHIEASANSLDHPLRAVRAGGTHHAIEPHLLPQHQCGALRPVSQPAPTVVTSGAIGLVEAFLVNYYGTGHADSVDDPLASVTTKDRHALVRPVVTINGERYQLDVRFRMLQPHELAGAQGFLPGYKFTGNKTEQVKQIGNAVTRRLARAIVTASIRQDPDVSFLTDHGHCTAIIPKEAA